MKTFKIEDIFQPGTFGIFDATTGVKVAHQHTLDMFANSANVANSANSANKGADTKTETEVKNNIKNGNRSES